jgi:hypothetical protein
LLKGVVDDPGAGHRLDDGADRLAVDLVDAAGEPSQRVDVGWNAELVKVLSVLGEQADINFLSTQVESSVQHVKRASSVLVFRDTTSVSPKEALLHGSPKQVRAPTFDLPTSHLVAASLHSGRRGHADPQPAPEGQASRGALSW